MKPGHLRHILPAEEPMHGPDLAWMLQKKLFMLLRVLHHSISMEETGKGKTFLPIQLSHWMPIRENDCGIFKRDITTYGIAISQHPHMHFLALNKTLD